MENTTKMLGGWGYIGMIFFGIFGSFLGPVAILALAGAIIVLVAFIRAGGELGRPEVKTNIIIALVLYIVAAVLFIFLVGAGVLTYALHHDSAAAAAGLGAGVIVGGIIAWILAIVAAWFWYKASVPLTEETGIGLYKVGGLLIFIGAITIVVFGLGAIVSLVGEILQTVAFFTTPEKRLQAIDTPTSAL
ncbi:MAG: DUF996 domain-containing protein [Gammaproteobacteria bacterium]